MPGRCATHRGREPWMVLAAALALLLLVPLAAAALTEVALRVEGMT